MLHGGDGALIHYSKDYIIGVSAVISIKQLGCWELKGQFQATDCERPTRNLLAADSGRDDQKPVRHWSSE